MQLVRQYLWRPLLVHSRMYSYIWLIQMSCKCGRSRMYCSTTCAHLMPLTTDDAVCDLILFNIWIEIIHNPKQIHFISFSSFILQWFYFFSLHFISFFLWFFFYKFSLNSPSLDERCRFLIHLQLLLLLGYCYWAWAWSWAENLMCWCCFCVVDLIHHLVIFIFFYSKQRRNFEQANL